MGIDYALFDRLVDLSTRFRPEGRVLMLGRQGFDMPQKPRAQARYRRSLATHGVTGDVDALVQEDGFAETLFRKLGLGDAEAMDFSDYEGATIVHDLNTLPDESLEGEFDLILDGGTLEHVFHLPNAFEGIFRMLKPGGRFVSMSCYNGWPTHGMYQFTAELFWSYWVRSCNCRLIDCRAIQAQPKHVDDGQVILSDAARRGGRLRGILNKIGRGRVFLYCEVEKTRESHLPAFTLQSDYETSWHGHDNAGVTRLDETGS